MHLSEMKNKIKHERQMVHASIIQIKWGIRLILRLWWLEKIWLLTEVYNKNLSKYKSQKTFWWGDSWNFLYADNWVINESNPKITNTIYQNR